MSTCSKCTQGRHLWCSITGCECEVCFSSRKPIYAPVKANNEVKTSFVTAERRRLTTLPMGPKPKYIRTNENRQYQSEVEARDEDLMYGLEKVLHGIEMILKGVVA